MLPPDSENSSGNNDGFLSTLTPRGRDYGLIQTKKRLALAKSFEKSCFDLDDPSSWHPEVRNSAYLEGHLYEIWSKLLLSMDPSPYLREYWLFSRSDRARFFEFLGSLGGHPSHPCSKNRTATHVANPILNSIVAYSPETFPLFALHLVAVHTSICRVLKGNADIFCWTELLSDNTMKDWNLFIEKAGGLPQNYQVFPVHPLTFEYLKDRFSRLVSKKLLILDGCPTEEVTPTISFRTIRLRNVDIKLPVNLQMTSLERYLSSIEVALSLSGDLFLEFPQLHFLKDVYGGYLIEVEGLSYEDTRYLSYIVRESPYETDRLVLPIAALITPVLAEAPICEIASFSGLDSRSFFLFYARFVIQTTLLSFFETGKLIMPHGQNGLIEFDEKYLPVYLRYRESAGGVYVFKPLMHTELTYSNPRLEVYLDLEECVYSYYHVNIRHHLLMVADHLDCERHLIRDSLEAEVGLLNKEIAANQYVQEFLDLLRKPRMPRFALLTMREQDSREPLYEDHHNELYP